MELGKHVLIEKPMTVDLAEADALVWKRPARLASKLRWHLIIAGSRLIITDGSQSRAGPIGRPISAYARKNDTIYVPTEYISWAAQTTPAWFLSCHDIDLVRWFFASEPVEARAWGVKRVLAGQRNRHLGHDPGSGSFRLRSDCGLRIGVDLSEYISHDRGFIRRHQWRSRSPALRSQTRKYRVEHERKRLRIQNAS